VIKFKSLRFRNAVTFEEKTLVPLKGQGRVFLAGDNQDTGGSNGAGKSTIFEVLQHILFSSTSKGFARNKFAGTGYMAELRLEVDGHDYKILQFRGATNQERKNGYKIHKDGVDVTPKGTRHIEDCIAYIKGVIGITEDEFRGYVYLAQEGKGHVLITGKGAEKRNYLSDLFNLDRYDLVKEGVEAELDTIKAQVATLSEKAAVRNEIAAQLEDIPLAAADFDGLLESIAHTATFLQEKDEAWSAKLRVADDARSRADERSGVRRKLDTLFPNWRELDAETESAERRTKLRKITTRIGKLEALKDILDEKAELEEDFIENLTTNEQEAAQSLNDTQAVLVTLNNELKGIHRRLALEEKLPDVSAVGKDVPERLTAAQGSLEVIRHRLSEGRETLERLSQLTTAECPTCGQSLDIRAIAEQRSKVNTLVTTMEEALVSTKREIGTLQKLADRLEERTSLEGKIGELPDADLASHKAAIRAYEAQVEGMETVLEQARENARIARRLAELSGELSGFSDALDVSKLDEFREMATKTEKALAKLETIKALKSEFSGMDEVELLPPHEYDRLAELANFYHGALAELAVQKQDALTQKKASETLQVRLSDLETQLEDWEATQHRKSLFEAMKAAYGPKGLKIHQLKRVCNAICRTLPKHTTIMFQEPRVEFFVDNDPDSTDIEFYVRRFTPEGTKEYPVGMLSGGEKKRLAVAMIFSLAELVSPRKRCNLVILDEVGDGLDPIGEEAFASQLLPQLKQDTVICTSHRSGIAAAQFDKHWTVLKKGNVSKLKT
jgi:DNA repair exonuclease SbcCD ATPase subunit